MDTGGADSGIIVREVLPHRGVPQKCILGSVSGTTVRSGHVLGVPYLTVETRHFDTYPNRIGCISDTYQCLLRCVWKRFLSPLCDYSNDCGRPLIPSPVVSKYPTSRRPGEPYRNPAGEGSKVSKVVLIVFLPAVAVYEILSLMDEASPERASWTFPGSIEPLQSQSQSSARALVDSHTKHSCPFFPWSFMSTNSPQDSGLPFYREFLVMNFHSEGMDFVMDFCVNFLCGFLGAFRPFKQRTENSQRNPQQKSRQNPCKIHACSEKRRRKIYSAGRGARQGLPEPAEPIEGLEKNSDKT